MTFQNVKGTRDFFPEQMKARKEFFFRMEGVAKRYGYDEVESPAFEYEDLLTAKSGDEIKHQIFVLEKRSTELLGLRFDLTVPMTRMFIQKQKELPKPVKWYCISRMWRYEKPQAGRLREFYQVDIENFGSEYPEADAEVIAIAIDMLQSFGLTKDDVMIKLNNRYLIEGYLETIGVKEKEIEEVMRVIDKKSKVTEEEFRRDLVILQVDQFKKLLDFLEMDLTQIEKLYLNKKAKEGLENVKKVLSILEKMGKADFMKFDPSIARGLAYYTGTVFECFDRQGKFRAILGGGRYDKMIELFGGESCPATGFAMGDVVIEMYLKEKGLWPEEKNAVDFYIAPFDESCYAKAYEVAEALRKKYTVSMDIMQRKIGKQMAYANSIGAKKVIIIGEDEIKNNEIAVKDMDSGKQEKVSMDKIDEI